MQRYRRVSLEDRYQIRAYVESGIRKGELAEKLGFHRATIYREISRNKSQRKYRPEIAHQKYLERYGRCRRKRLISGVLQKIVLDRLNRGWSPEQICGRFKRDHQYRICHETIYRYLERDRLQGGSFYKLLRRQNRKRRRRFPRHARESFFDELSIQHRPKIVEERRRLGDWERDCMLGRGRKAILVCVERKSRYLKIEKLKNKEAWTVFRTTCEALRKSKAPCYTITNDRGREFADANWFYSKHWYMPNLGIPVYYCDPYASRQRGTIENTIGLLRQYFPKGFDVKKTSTAKLRHIEKLINSRPRKCLGFKTPIEVLSKNTVALVK